MRSRVAHLSRIRGCTILVSVHLFTNYYDSRVDYVLGAMTIGNPRVGSIRFGWKAQKSSGVLGLKRDRKENLSFRESRVLV